MNDEIPNLTGFDQSAINQAFAELERQARSALEVLQDQVRRASAAYEVEQRAGSPLAEALAAQDEHARRVAEAFAAEDEHVRRAADAIAAENEYVRRAAEVIAAQDEHVRRAGEAIAAQDEYVRRAAEAFRLEWLGRKHGRLSEVSGRWLKAAPPEAKKLVGQRFNEFKERLEGLVDAALDLDIGPSDAALKAEAVDITLPGTRRLTGAEHPITRTMNEIVQVFAALGYSVGVGPEVETDYYNFESMNFPHGHPARDTQDTLVVAGQERRPVRDRLLLRTHTSPVQMRTMELQPPPVRIVIPGKVHRNDAADATHSPIFHQVEGLCVDVNITFSDLKGTLDHAMKALFGSAVKTRFFPSFFPFTEPSADVQISCIFCGGKGCRKCKQSGWIELLGCGMVDPAVFAFAAQKQPAYDAKQISGFAFGMGVERIAMMKYGISEIGQFFAGDMRFLGQFA